MGFHDWPFQNRDNRGRTTRGAAIKAGDQGVRASNVAHIAISILHRSGFRHDPFQHRVDVRDIDLLLEKPPLIFRTDDPPAALRGDCHRHALAPSPPEWGMDVCIVMGSKSDLPVGQKCTEILERFNIDHELR